MVSKRSAYSQPQKNEEDSRTIISGHFNRNFWKFRDVHDRDNDLDGFIEVFEKEEDGVHRTTGKFLKAQLKSVDNDSVKINDGIITYTPTAKFVQFCDVCDEPVILFVCNVEDGKTYHLWMQDYIYSVLDKENPNWRNNTSSVTVKFNSTPLDDSVITNNLNKIAINGYKQTFQRRESGKYTRYTENALRDAHKGKVFFASVVSYEGQESIRPVYIASNNKRGRIFVVPITSRITQNSLDYSVNVSFLKGTSTFMIGDFQELLPYKLLKYIGTLPSSDINNITIKVKTLF